MERKPERGLSKTFSNSPAARIRSKAAAASLFRSTWLPESFTKSADLASEKILANKLSSEKFFALVS